MAEIKKSKKDWQSIAKKLNIKFQSNDTVGMLITSIAHEIGVDTKKFKTDYKLKIEVLIVLDVNNKKPKEPVKKQVEKPETSVKTKKQPTKKVAAKKPPTKPIPTKNKEETKKVVDKKEIEKPTPHEEFKLTDFIKSLPNFKDKLEMKAYCVSVGLNRVEGYIQATKMKKVDFLTWMIDNFKNIEEIKNNPHSPSAGLGELKGDNIEKAKADLGGESIETPNEGVEDKKEENDAHVKTDDSVNIQTPKVQPDNSTNKPPTAITMNEAAMNYNGEESNVSNEEANTIKADSDTDLKEMEIYGNSIMMHINSSPRVSMMGGMPQNELRQTLDVCDSRYSYKIKDDKEGSYIEIANHNGDSIRVPKKGKLPLI